MNEDGGVSPGPAAADAADGRRQEPGLRRNSIGLFESTVLGCATAAPGQVIAISLVPFIAASKYGMGLPLLITTATMIGIAVSFQRLNLWRQDCGGPYAWVSEAVNPHVGFLVGWVLLATFVLVNIINVTSLGPAFLAFVGLDASSSWGSAVAGTILTSLLVTIAVIGIKMTARVQVTIAVIEYAILIGFAIFFLIKLGTAPPAGSVPPNTDWLRPSGTGGGSFAPAVLVAIFFIAQWDGAIYENEETERPARNPGLAAILSVLFLGAIYTLLSFAFAGAAPLAEMRDNSSNVAVFAAERLAGQGWDTLMALAVLFSTMATTQIAIAATARITLSMGRDQVVDQRFARISPRYQTPVWGMVVLTIVAIVIAWIYIFSSSVAGAFEHLINTIGILFAIYYAATALAAVWQSRRELRGVKDFLVGALLPLMSAGVLIWIFVLSMGELSGADLWALIGILAAGLGMLFVAVRVYRAPLFERRREQAVGE